MTKLPWEVWYATVVFEDKDESKDRPVVILEDDGRRCRALGITSKAGKWGDAHRYALIYWEYAGLDRKSWVKLGDDLILEPKDFVRKLKRLHPVDEVNLNARLLEYRSSRLW